MKFFLTILIVVLSQSICVAQVKDEKALKIFLSAGYGGAGSFFVRSYDEALPFPSLYYKAFFKKNFIGVGQELAIGVHLKKKIDVKFGFQYQRFSRHVQVNDTLPRGVGLILDNKIHHVNSIWFASITKNYIRRNRILSWGGGLYYIRPQQQEVEIFSNFIIDRERNQKNSRLNEAGAFTEIAYEYKFQPKVNIGIKSQFYYTISSDELESITLFPFIKLNF